MKKVMFVCHGNICRSPMAEFVMRDMVKKRGLESEFVIASSATSTEEIGNDIHPGTRRTLQKYGVPFTRREAVQITRSDYDKYDFFIGMDSANVRNLGRIFGADPENKIKKLLDFTSRGGDVADPWYSDRFDIAYRDIYDGCMGLWEELK